MRSWLIFSHLIDKLWPFKEINVFLIIFKLQWELFKVYILFWSMKIIHEFKRVQTFLWTFVLYTSTVAYTQSIFFLQLRKNRQAAKIEHVYWSQTFVIFHLTYHDALFDEKVTLLHYLSNLTKNNCCHDNAMLNLNFKILYLFLVDGWILVCHLPT